MSRLPDAPLPPVLQAFAPAADVNITDMVFSDVPLDAAPGIVGEIHEHSLPDFIVAALDRLYGSMHSSARYFRLCEPGQPLPHAWVGWRRGEIVGALLFRIQRSRVKVLTEMLSIDSSVVDAFCRSAFGRYPQVSLIHFNAVQVVGPLLRWPSLSSECSEDHVIELPATVDMYRAGLGKSTRKTLNGYGNRIERELPGLQWHCVAGDAISFASLRSLVRQLQRFKRESMQERGKRAAIDRRDTARLLLLARERGLIGMAMLNGRLVAGSVACRFGEHYVMLLSAADPSFAQLRLGFLACYWAICDCIRYQASACHLLWGRYEYKRQLLGQLRPLSRLGLFRSKQALLCNPGMVTTLLLRGCLHRSRLGMLDCSRTVTKRINKFLHGNK